jgi:hypothetical protein
MRTRHRLVLLASSVLVGLITSGKARAISLPDTGSCSSTSADGCLKIANTATGNGGIGILATSAGTTGGAAVNASAVNGFGVLAASGGGIGVYGSSTSNVAVWGQGGSNAGVKGVSSSSNGILGITSATGLSAAAISAVSPDNDSLAYWGTGAIRISGSLAEKAGGGSWSAPSDERIKKDVSALKLGLAELKSVRPVTFKYNGLGGSDDNGREYVGVIAQELEKILPNMVSSRKGKLRKGDDQETDIKIVDPSAFTYLLVNAVKEQQRIIEKQDARIATLEQGRGRVASSILTGGIGTGVALSLLPLGVVVALRRRKGEKAR